MGPGTRADVPRHGRAATVGQRPRQVRQASDVRDASASNSSAARLCQNSRSAIIVASSIRPSRPCPTPTSTAPRRRAPVHRILTSSYSGPLVHVTRAPAPATDASPMPAVPTHSIAHDPRSSRTRIESPHVVGATRTVTCGTARRESRHTESCGAETEVASDPEPPGSTTTHLPLATEPAPSALATGSMSNQPSARSSRGSGGASSHKSHQRHRGGNADGNGRPGISVRSIKVVAAVLTHVSALSAFNSSASVSNWARSKSEAPSSRSMSSSSPRRTYAFSRCEIDQALA